MTPQVCRNQSEIEYYRRSASASRRDEVNWMRVAARAQRSIATDLIGKDKRCPGQVGSKSLFAIETLKQAALPRQQIPIVGCEFIPGLDASPRHALADQQYISPGDRLMVTLRF